MLLKVNPDQWVWLLISILAVWRITSFICFDAGPFDAMTKIRLILYKLKLGKLIDCFHCSAVWVSIILSLAIYRVNLSTIFLTLAIAGGASVIEKIIFYDRNSNNSNEDT